MSNNYHMLEDDALVEVLSITRRRLAVLRKQQATFGDNAPPDKVLQIEDAEHEVQQIVTELLRRDRDPGLSDGSGPLLIPYLERVVQACNVLAFSDPHAGRPGRRPMRLAQVFTMLRVDADRNVVQALNKTRACVLLGEPGGGKSTVFNFLAAALAAAALGEAAGLARLGRDRTAGPLLPLRVRLKEVSNSLWEAAPDVQAAGLNDADRQLLISVLESRLRAGTAILLLDGLDEVTTAERLAKVLNLIANAREDYRRSRIVVSCRVFDYRNEPGRRIVDLPELQLQRFDAQGQARFVARWYSELAAAHPDLWTDQAVQQKGDDLQAALQARPELAAMAGNPLLLALITLVHTRDGELPPARALLYQRCVRTLLWDWRADERGALLEEGRLLRLAAELGYQAHAAEQREGKAFQGLGYGAVHAATLDFFTRGKSGQLERQKGEDEARAAARRLLNSNGLLLDLGGGRYGFAHRSLQHFLAGQYLGKSGNMTQALAHAADSHWRIAFHLLAGYEAREGNSYYALRLIEKLARRSTAEQVLAGEMLLEIGRQVLLDNGCADELEADGAWQHVAEALRRTAFSKPPCEPDAHLRNRAAEILDLLGEDDERPGLRLEQPDYWAVRIEPGTFRMGGKGSENEREKPAFDFTIKQPYTLARFPVTNRQYARFLASLSEEEAAKRRPSHWNGSSYPAGQGTHPVVRVSWEDASAFAHWADATLISPEARARGAAIRLPTEPEWERAAAYPPGPLAAGEAGCRYPWGDDWREDHANTRESGIQGTTVVGIFPQGAAACGAEEMAGNVWEWCSTAYLSYPLPDNLQAETFYTRKSRINRTYVLRGGSWYSDQSYARCASRSHGTPRYGFDHYGFRLARLFS